MPMSPKSDRSRGPIRRVRAPRPKKRSIFRQFFNWALGFVFTLGVIAAVVLTVVAVRLDGDVREKFEGRRWAMPARVYARPLELYQELLLSPQEFLSNLRDLGYRETAETNKPGTFLRQDNDFIVYTRQFMFSDGEEKPRLVNISFADGRVNNVLDLNTGDQIDLLRLDPLLIGSIYPQHQEDRILVKASQLPDILVKGLIAVEDRAFYDHYGLNPKGIVRALVANARAGRPVEGGSTLTQQLVKNFYLTNERSLSRKAKEAIMALLLEYHYSKQEILEAYANEIYLGQDGSRAIHGFSLASKFYFDTDLSDITLPQAALLVTLVRGPSAYDPRRHPEAALKRRNLVLDLMAQNKAITLDQAREAQAAPLEIAKIKRRSDDLYPGFISLVKSQLKRDYADDDLRSEGLNIFTTLNTQIQDKAQSLVPKSLSKIERRRGLRQGTLQGAIVITSTDSGEVLALVGDRNPDRGYAGYNRALNAVRSIGSLVKPAVYLAALSHPERFTLTSIVHDKPVSIPDGRTPWRPHNASRRAYGDVRLMSALIHSFNLSVVNLTIDMGGRLDPTDKLRAKLNSGMAEVSDMLTRLGVNREINQRPSMLLGALALSPLEVAQMYQTIAGGGYRTPLRAITSVVRQDGQSLNRYPLSVDMVVDPKVAYLVTWTMKQIVTKGTARALSARLPKGLTVAGKTGTTNNQRDSWFAGFTGDKVAIAWVGRDDNKPTRLSGSTGGLVLWADVMLQLENSPILDNPPEGIVFGSPCGQKGVPYIEYDDTGENLCGRRSRTSDAETQSDSASRTRSQPNLDEPLIDDDPGEEEQIPPVQSEQTQDEPDPEPVPVRKKPRPNVFLR